MSPERWLRIEELYHAAFARPAAERRSFLEEACQSDAKLCEEVVSLLDHAPEEETSTVPPTGQIGRAALLGTTGLNSVWARAAWAKCSGRRILG